MTARDDMGQEIARGIARGIARRIAIGIAFFIAFVLFILIGGVIVQWLWNWLMPGIFGLRAITWLEALGLLALSRILFGGFGRGGSHGPSRHRRDWWKKPNGDWHRNSGETSSAAQPAGGAS